jgi:hypothetical protein
MARNKQKRRKRILIVLAVLLVATLIGGFFANRFVKTKGYKNIIQFVSIVGGNYVDGLSADYESIEIEIDKKDFKKLEKVRNEALKRGVMINVGDNYVPATIKYNGKTTKVKLRLKGHMTDHIKGNKWSFRVKTDKKKAVFGMQRFTLQHPGTRNYGFEWMYHEMLKKEGIIALRYNFINVTLNGEDLGIYAIEEHFGQELIQNNDRLSGPIIRFNPSLYWEGRINEMNRVAMVEEYKKFQSANVEAYNRGTILDDDKLTNYFVNSMILMEGFRRGELKVGQVFDVEKMAKFHAIIDIVGGHHSLDWSDVKYYYNPASMKLEPVGYESFSIRKISSIAGNYKYTEEQNYVSGFHTALFNDADFFRSYIQALDRMSKPAYLKAFFKEVNSEWEKKKAIVYSEFPYKDHNLKGYYTNQKIIRKLLDSPKGFNAYLTDLSSDTLKLRVGGVHSLPHEITEIRVGETVVPITTPIIIPSKLKNRYINYKEFEIPLPATAKVKASDERKIQITYSILGGGKTKTEEVLHYPGYEKNMLAGDYLMKEANAESFDFLRVDDSVNVIWFTQGKCVIDRDLIIPSGYTVKGTDHLEIVLNNNARIVSRSPFEFNGLLEEEPIWIHSEDSTGQGIVILETVTKSIFRNVKFDGLGAPNSGQFSHDAAITFYAANSGFLRCQFINLKGKHGLQAIRSTMNMKDCFFMGSEGNSIKGNFMRSKLDNIAIEDCGADGINLTGSSVFMKKVRVQRAGDNGIVAKEGTNVNGGPVQIWRAKYAVVSRDKSIVNITTLNLKHCNTGLKASQKGDVFGPSRISVKKLVAEDVATQKETEKGSKIKIGK